LATHRFARQLTIFSVPLIGGGPCLLAGAQPQDQTPPSPQPSPPSGAREFTYTSHKM
jgi:hypothetical protein